jgi:hypothetical protein
MKVKSQVQRLSNFWLLVLPLGWQVLGAEFEGSEQRERLFVRRFEQRFEPGLRENFRQEIGFLCKAVAEVTALPDAKRKALEEKLAPVGDSALEVWRLALQFHYQTMPTVEDAESVAFLGDALLHPDVVAADRKAMQFWDSALEAELGAGAFARWKLRENELRADYAKANAAMTAKIITQASRTKATFWQAKIKRVAAVVGWPEEVVKTLMDLAVDTAQSFEYGFTERMREALPKADELLLGCSTEAVAELRRQPTRTLYPPRMRSLQEAAQRVIDDAISLRLNADEKKKLTDHEAELNTRLTEAAKGTVKRQLDQPLKNPLLIGSTRLPTLVSILSLPTTTAEALKKTIDAGESEAMAVWAVAIEAEAVRRMRVMVKERDPEEVIKSLENSNWRWSTDEADRELVRKSNSLWQAALKAQLTPEQVQRWLSEERQQQERKTLALLKLTVSEVDIKVGLQANQRNTLEVALRPVAEKVAQIPGGSRAALQWGSLDGSLMLLEGLETGQLEQLLTPLQMTKLEASSSRYKAYWRTVQAKLDLLQEDGP